MSLHSHMQTVTARNALVNEQIGVHGTATGVRCDRTEVQK